jgi:hypothetical protein
LKNNIHEKSKLYILILDLAFGIQGQTLRQTFNNTLALAKSAKKWLYILVGRTS